jgi:hypothetical protein
LKRKPVKREIAFVLDQAALVVGIEDVRTS